MCRANGLKIPFIFKKCVANTQKWKNHSDILVLMEWSAICSSCNSCILPSSSDFAFCSLASLLSNKECMCPTFLFNSSSSLVWKTLLAKPCKSAIWPHNLFLNTWLWLMQTRISLGNEVGQHVHSSSYQILKKCTHLPHHFPFDFPHVPRTLQNAIVRKQLSSNLSFSLSWCFVGLFTWD